MWKPKSTSDSEWDLKLNPYDSFMRKHLQHYGYYTGKNTGFRSSATAFEDWDKTQGYELSSCDSSSSDDDNDDDKDQDEKDNKTQEDLMRTTQLVYSYQQGKMVPKLREPRQLYGFNISEIGPQQAPRWPAEIQVLNEPVKHLHYVPLHPDPFYKLTGMEKMPMSRSANQEGRIVFQYEPVVGGFFMRSRVGGSRNGCSIATVHLESPQDTTLLFESRFESGNLARAVQVGQYEYELWLRNDLYTNKHTQWFYFRVSNTRPNVTYRFTIVNLMKPDSLYNCGMRPLMYSNKSAIEKKVGWVRAGSDIKYYKNNVKYTIGKYEKSYYSLTWTTQFDHERDTVYFAHCYPYTYTDLQDYITALENDPVKCKLCKQRVLCRSLAGNLVYLLTITSPFGDPDEIKHRKAVVITSRVHPGESNASWMMKGFLDYVLGSSADAKLLRDTFVFKIIPMLNPDGVIVGNYRCSLTGRDLNRNYKTVLKDSFPSIWNTRNMMRKLLHERDIIMYCDLHGHSRKQNVFIYGCDNHGSASRRLRERIFPVMLSRNAPDKFSYESCKFKVQKSKEGTGRIVMWNMGILNSYTMEATFAGSSIGKLKGHHFRTSDFESMGFHFCDTLLDYCDPDNTKSAKILVELEDRMKADILQHLKAREGAEAMGKDLSDINLDDDYMSDVETSDGGSDSSDSDGLPVHLQFMADKIPKRKKKMKSKKERDKHKCPMPDDKKKPPSQAFNVEHVEKKTVDLKPKLFQPPMRYSNINSKKTEEKPSSGSGIIRKNIAATEQKQVDQPDKYLEALTSAYLRGGILRQEQQNKEIPHFRYTAAARPVPSLPVNLEGMCPQHEKAFAAQYVANHIQGLNYSGALPGYMKLGVMGRRTQVHLVERRIRDQTITHIVDHINSPIKDMHFDNTETFIGNHHTVRNHGPKPINTKSDTSPQSFPIERKFSHHRLMEGQKEQPIHQEFIPKTQYEQEPCPPRDIKSPIKQHPPPFDETLERDKSHDYVRPRGVSAQSTQIVSSSKSSLGQMQDPMFETSSMCGAFPLSRDEGNTNQNHNSSSPPLSRGFRPKSRGAGSHSDGQHGALYSLDQRKQGSWQKESRKAHDPFASGTHDRKHAQHMQSSMSSFDVSNVPRTRHRNVPKSTKELYQLNELPSKSETVSANSRLQSTTSSNTVAASTGKMSLADSSRLHQPLSNPDAEISDTMKSINEIRDALLDPAQRVNLSPTTGQFIDHFVRKTDKEIDAIHAQLTHDLEDENQFSNNFLQERCEFSTSFDPIPDSSQEQHAALTSLSKSKTKPHKANFQFNSGSYEPSFSNKDPPVHRTEKTLPSTDLNKGSGQIVPTKLESRSNERSDVGILGGHYSRSSCNLATDHGSMPFSQEEDTIKRGLSILNVGTLDLPANKSGHGRSLESPELGDFQNQYNVPQNDKQKVSSTKRNGASPSKISLMISSGHQDAEQCPSVYTKGNFFPGSRQPRPPQRNLFKKR